MRLDQSWDAPIEMSLLSSCQAIVHPGCSSFSLFYIFGQYSKWFFDILVEQEALYQRLTAKLSLISLEDSFYGAEPCCLIPLYQRREGAIRAVQSIVSQANVELENGSLLIHVRDDSSPDIEFTSLVKLIKSIHPSISIDRNSTNLGMSANIRSMVLDCKASFCTILTDDDWLERGSISFVMEFIQDINSGLRNDVSCLFCPRFSYNELNVYVSTSCRISDSDFTISSSPINTARFADKGYILTGLFFRPDLVDHSFWSFHEHNAFFPILYFASLLSMGDCSYVDRPLVHHTVDNLCHWEAWGMTFREQQQRLCRDFLSAVHLVHGYVKPNIMLLERYNLWIPKIITNRNRIVEMLKVVSALIYAFHFDSGLTHCFLWHSQLLPIFLQDLLICYYEL